MPESKPPPHHRPTDRNPRPVAMSKRAGVAARCRTVGLRFIAKKSPFPARTGGGECGAMQDIRHASGVSNGNILHHFGSKNGVALHVYLAERRSYRDHAASALEAFDGDPVDALGAAARATLADQPAHTERHVFMIECASSTWTHAHAEPVRARYAEFTERCMAWAMPHVAAGRLAPAASRTGRGAGVRAKPVARAVMADRPDRRSADRLCRSAGGARHPRAAARSRNGRLTPAPHRSMPVA